MPKRLVGMRIVSYCFPRLLRNSCSRISFRILCRILRKGSGQSEDQPRYDSSSPQSSSRNASSIPIGTCSGLYESSFLIQSKACSLSAFILSFVSIWFYRCDLRCSFKQESMRRIKVRQSSTSVGRCAGKERLHKWPECREWFRPNPFG